MSNRSNMSTPAVVGRRTAASNLSPNPLQPPSATTTPPPPRMVPLEHKTSGSKTRAEGSVNEGGRRGQSEQAFYPGLILSQMLALQCFHYVFFGLVIQINHVFFGTSITLDRVFSTKYLNVWSAVGWIDNAAVLSTFVIQALLLALIVERARKCLDFSVTLFFIHFWICTIYNWGVPATWDWWIIHILGTIIMILLGEYLCSRIELAEIPLLPL
mmetsp:Transcript_4809/g.6484  ORF Transcript_4809/g.6484 Transcript_4809/m.6484 type:complete len:214 (-) Transcript_4809:615-1256(-)